MPLGGPELLLLLVIGGIPLAVILWGLIDAAGRPAPAWAAAGQSKSTWVLVQALGLLVCWAGTVLSIYYLARIRPKLVAAAT